MFTAPLAVVAWEVFTHYSVISGDIDSNRTTYVKPITFSGLNDNDDYIIKQPDGLYIVDGGDYVDPDGLFDSMHSACEYVRKQYHEKTAHIAEVTARREEKSR